MTIALGWLASSCSTESDDYMEPIVVPGNAVLSGPSNIDLYPLGDKYTITFTAPEWEVSGSIPEWLNMSNVPGIVYGSKTIVIGANANKSKNIRNTEINFISRDNSFNVPIKIHQQYPYLNVNVDSMWFDWNDTTLNTSQLLNIKSNLYWKVKTIWQDENTPVSAEHFSLPASSEVMRDYADIDIFPSEWNLGIEPYNVHVELIPLMYDRTTNTLKEYVGDACQPVLLKLCQKNLRFLIDGGIDNMEYNLDELNSSPIRIQVDAESPWKIADIPNGEVASWAKLSVSEGVGITDIVLQADGANPTTNRRSGWIRLLSEAGAYRDIFISQDPYIFNFLNVPKDGFVDENNITLIINTFTLNTTGTWYVSNIPEWVDISPKSGADTTTLTIKTLERNMSTDDLIANIKVASSLNDISENIKVISKAFDFNIDYDESLFASLPTLSTGPFDIKIQSSGAWEIRNISDWITLSRTSGVAGSTNITMTVDPIAINTNRDREGSFTVVSLEHETLGIDLTHTVNLSHKQYTYNVTGDLNISYPAYSENYDNCSVDVECSVDWSVVDYPEWITPSVTGGIGSGVVTVKFIPNSNTTSASRSGTITIKTNHDAPYNGTTTINVTQEGFVFDNTDPVSYENISASQGGTYRIPFTMTDGAGWSVTSTSNWISVNPTSGKGSGEVVCTIPMNDKQSYRSGSVTIKSNVTGQEKVVSFSQLPFVFDVDTESLEYSYNSKANNSVIVECSGAWSVECNEEWVNIEMISGSDSNGSFSISVDENSEFETREASIVVKSTLNGFTHSISLTQAAAPIPEENEDDVK